MPREVPVLASIQPLAEEDSKQDVLRRHIFIL